MDAASADGGATDGARLSRHHHHHRRPRAPAMEGTKSGSVMHDAASVRPERGFSAVVHYSESAPATASTAAVIIGGSRRKHRAAGSYSTTVSGDSYYASDDQFAAASRLVRERERQSASPRPHRPAKPNGEYSAAADGVPARGFTGGFGRYDSPSVAARPNGTVTGGKHRCHQAAVDSSSGGGDSGAYYADDYAAASSSYSRLIREPAAPPPLHHRPPKPHKDHGAPSSSAPPPLEEPSADVLFHVGLEVASNMDKTTIYSMVKQHIDRNQQAEAVEEESLHFWRPLTDDEVEADLRAIYDKVASQRAAASGSGKRRRH